MTSTTWMKATAAALVIMAGVLAGCDTLGKNIHMSLDRHVYESTVQLPTNVAVVEPYSGEVLWSMEVPVEHKLTLDFSRKNEAEPASVSGHPATSMSWKLSGARKESGKVSLPGTPVGMKVSYRQAPEFPEGRGPASTQPRIDPIQPEPAAPADDAPPADEAAPAATNGAVENAIKEDVKAAEPIEQTEPADEATK